MTDCKYWKDIVAKLRSERNWAAHVLASDEYNLAEARKCVADDEIIENVIYAYEDWSAQPYCDEILFQFEKELVERVFNNIKGTSKNMRRGVEGFLTL